MDGGKMGWWNLEAWKEAGRSLTDIDREHIAELIKEGYTEGEEDDEEDENKLGETDSGVPTGASYFSEKCPKCGNKMELIQGQSDNKDIDGIYKCPKCGYVEEIE